ncbi:uncharacterized protein LOC134176185 isoform X2 [Corticium candelabrum]|uniref:uncharacterized protein LOC134176185 isoform X2 n=1 Tax=Corticium candelabrum TaxID=121492 RepID=UPI002E25CDAC|nr:uncharacterized protein LOC134176185 isoform X2 [Corticium candelabrum]
MSTSQQDDYQRYITDNMVELVQKLCVSAIIDHLLSHRLVTMEEGHQLSRCSTEQDRARMLFYHILPYKGNDVVGRLCNVLVDAGQHHIISEVMRKEVRQPHVVQRLTTTENTHGTPSDLQVAATGVGEMEMLKDQAVGDKIVKTMHVLEEAKKVIYKATGDSGSVEIQGRTLQYEVKGGFYKWKYQFTGKAWDSVTEITVNSKGWKSSGGAREHVLKDLVAELRKKGFLK